MGGSQRAQDRRFFFPYSIDMMRGARRLALACLSSWLALSLSPKARAVEIEGLPTPLSAPVEAPPSAAQKTPLLIEPAAVAASDLTPGADIPRAILTETALPCLAATATGTPLKPATVPPPVAARLQELGETVSAEIERVGDLPTASAQTAEGLGRRLSNEVVGQRDAAVGGEVSPDPVRRSDLLSRLGLREKILINGGIPIEADGSIKPVSRPIKFLALDNDDNIAHYPHKAYFRHKVTGQEIAIYSAKFAKVRPHIGKTGEFKDYDFFDIDKDYGGTFRDSFDVVDPDVFPKQVKEAIDGAPAAMFRGPSWFQFAVAMADPAAAPWVAVVTSRGHKPANMVRGYEVFRAHGLIARVPREELIFPVNGDDVSRVLSYARNTMVPERKVEVLLSLLDLIESVPLANPDDHHSFGFSDDDFDMITRIKNRLSLEQSVHQRWPHVKITVFSSGPGKESVTEL